MKKVLFVACAVVLLLGAFQGAASAASGKRADERGDAPSAVDITQLKVVNGTSRVWMRVKVKDLTRAGDFSFYYWGGTKGTPPARSALATVSFVDGKPKAKFYECGRSDCTREACAGTRVAWRRGADTLAISLRQRCFPGRTPNIGRFFAAGELDREFDQTRGTLRVRRG